MIILVHGKRCTGKDYIIMLLEHLLGDNSKHYHITAFADAVKRKVAAQYNLDYEKLIGKYSYKQKYRDLIIDCAESHKRKYGKWWWAKKSADSWMDGGKSACTRTKHLIVTDLRFVDELKYMQKFGKAHKQKVIVLGITAAESLRREFGWTPDPEIDEHESEKGNFKCDYTIENCKNHEILENRIREFYHWVCGNLR